MSLSIGKRIVKLREKKGWTLADLSDKTGIKAQTINAIELGKSANPTMVVIGKLAVGFDVSTDYLIFGKAKTINDLELLEVPSGKIYIQK